MSEAESTAVAKTQQRREMITVESNIPVMDTGKLEHMQRIATILATSGLVPEHLNRIRKVKGGQEIEISAAEAVANCFLVVNQAVRWQMDPFAVAQGVFVTKGKIGYEGKLIAAVINTHPMLEKRLSYTFDGEVGKPTRRVTVSGRIKGDPANLTVEGTVGQWRTDNDAWSKSGDQMLTYRGAREWARRYMPEAVLGVYADDELDAPLPVERDVTPAQPERSASARLAAAVGATETVGVVGSIRAGAKGEVIDMDTGEVLGIGAGIITNAEYKNDQRAQNAAAKATMDVAATPTPFDKEPAAEPAKPAPTPLEAGEALRTRIAAAPDNDALTAILKEVMALPASALRNKIMQEWNAKVKSFAKPATAQPAAPEPPADARPAPQAGTTQSAPPAPAEPPKRGKKTPGTDEMKNSVIDSMKKAKTQDELDVVADAAQMYAWTGDHLKELNEAYLSLMRVFE